MAHSARALTLVWAGSPCQLPCHISLGRAVSCQHGAFSGVGAFVVSFVPAECPVGGGMWDIFGKPLKRAIQNARSACCTDDMFEIFVHFGRCLCCLLHIFVNR